MTAPAYTTATANDAGLLREYLAHRYGQYLTFGGSLGYSSYRFLEFSIQRLAKMTGTTVEQVRADLRADADVLFS